MSTEIKSKLNSLLSAQPLGTVLVSAWLVEQGYSLDLQKRYKKSHWFESIGTGALVRYGDQVDYLGAVYALQAQLGSSLHPAAKTALSLQGRRIISNSRVREHSYSVRQKSICRFGLRNMIGVYL